MTTERTAYIVILSILAAMLLCRVVTNEARPLDVLLGCAIGYAGGKLIETWKK